MRRSVHICLFALAVVLRGGPALAAGVTEVDERIFEQGARWRNEDYVRARDILVARGGAVLPLLRRKSEFEDDRERLFASILTARIQEPASVERWHSDLMSLVRDHAVLKAARTYTKIDWDKLPTDTVDIPPSHLADVLWEHAHGGSAGDREVTAVGIQFYLKPDMEALDAVVEASAYDHALRHLAKHGIVKLGPEAKPYLRKVLRRTIAMQPAKPWGAPGQTRKERALWSDYWRQTGCAEVAAHVLSELNDREAIPLISECMMAFTTKHTFVEEMAGHLANMQAIEAAEPMLDCMLRSATNRWYEGNGEKPGYVVLREHLSSLGDGILPVLQRRLAGANSEGEEVVLAKLVAELSGTKGKEKEVAAIRESLWFGMTTADLLRLRQLTGEDVFARLAGLVLGRGPRRYRDGRGRGDERTAACLAFGNLREVRAVPLLAEQIRKQHQSLERELDRRKTQEDAKPFDPQLAREVGYTFGGPATGLAKTLSWGDTCLLALRRIGGDEAQKVLIEAATFPEYKARASMSLLILEGKTDQILGYLVGADQTLREEAALALMEAGDGRATRELLCAAARRHGPSHLQWKQYGLHSSPNIRPVLRELATNGNTCERVLADAMLIEVDSPDVSAQVRKTLQEAASSVSMMHVQRIGMVEAAGLAVANKIDRAHVPLVESVCLFGQGVIRRGVAAYALSEFRNPRSMHVLAKSFNMGSLGGSNPAALALADYGKEGAELAARVPAPTPGEHDTGLRMTRHRGGTRVLAENKDIRGVDEILKGLATLRNDRSLSMWSHRMGIYLDAAGKFHDERLLNPLLEILAEADKPESRHHAEVIEILSAYDDERLVPLFTARLGTLNPRNQYPARDTLYGAALTALTRRLVARTPEYLIEQYNSATENRIRAATLLGLGELSAPDHPGFPGEQRWSPACFTNAEARRATAAAVREAAYPVLVQALEDDSVDVNQIAALGLTILVTSGNRPDASAIVPLNAWCRKYKTAHYSMIRYFADHGNAESGDAILAVLESQAPTKSDNHILFALESLKPEGGIPVLIRNVRAKARLQRKRWYPDECVEIKTLAHYGRDGERALLDLLAQVKNQPYEVQIAASLGQMGYRAAGRPISRLLASTMAAGPADPRLIPSGNNENLEDAYVRSCTTLLKSLHRADPIEGRKSAEQIMLKGPESLQRTALQVLGEEQQ